MGKALELGSTQVRLAQGCVPFVFTTRIPSEGTEALATLQPALNQTVADVAASGCWMGAGACVVAKCLGSQLRAGRRSIVSASKRTRWRRSRRTGH